VRQERPRVEEHRVPADGLHDGTPRARGARPRTPPARCARGCGPTETASVDADGHRLHVAPREPAVRVQALVEHDEVAGLLEEVVVVEREEAADVDEEVLLAAHGAAVGVRARLAQDLRDGASA
jgi:hypothetical protein